MNQILKSLINGLCAAVYTCVIVGIIVGMISMAIWTFSVGCWVWGSLIVFIILVLIFAGMDFIWS